jgi:hypothetical protein
LATGTTTPQRRWQAACPNCGAPVEFASGASASAVCSFCRSTLLREGEALRRIGQSAELFDDFSPLQLGAAGRYAGASFSVVGRLQIGYAAGSWNEWHVLFDSGRSGWLSEDNGAFVLGFDAPLNERAPQSHELVIGSQQVLAGLPWQVASLVEAQALAAEGELPQPPVLAKKFWVADLRNSQGEVATLDYSRPEAPQWSVGRAVALSELALTGLRAESAKSLGSQAVPCPSCGAALTPKLDKSQSIVCGQCHAVVDISKGVGSDLAYYAQQNGLEPQIRLGTTATLALSGGAPKPWQVVGYQERCDLPESSEDEQTFWREYLLFNQLEGFAFLVDSEDGWSLVRPITGAPKPASAGAVEWQGRVFRKRYDYQAKTTYVLGEFYWRVQREERVRVGDYEWVNGSRTELLSREQSDTELTWSHGRKLDAAEVLRAFQLAPELKAAFQRDAVSLGTSGSKLLRNIVIGLFLIALLFALLRGCRSDDCLSYKEAYGESSAEYQQCQRNSSGSGVFIGRSGGSYGGYSSGSGGHK